ncbi:MAG TPA: helix-turn-helix transcriptional regulator [Streptosporangiaceae bacterium]|nr:helix-turn-helix transcriptional regulator [Streptosporangiaceae bacterium]
MTDHGELGAALRGWRDRVAPADAGMPAGRGRRAPGLRREELALLAGVSADYITRLEQGRATAPSPQVLGALGRALRLSREEQDHLFRLAGQAPPRSGQISGQLPPSVQRLLDQLTAVPVGVNDAGWNLIAWNPLWAALTGDPSARTGRDRNILWRYFTGQHAGVVRTPEETARFERSTVADLRSATARYPDDPGLRQLVADLRAVSPRFAEQWDSRVVGSHRESHKTFDHPDVGLVTVDCDVLTVDGSDLRIVAYTAPPGSEAAEKLRLLSVIGTQVLR